MVVPMEQLRASWEALAEAPTMSLAGLRLIEAEECASMDGTDLGFADHTPRWYRTVLSYFEEIGERAEA